MNMQEKYGITGEVKYMSWENKFSKIQKDVKFGNADPENAFRELKREINSEVNMYLEKWEKRKKLAWILTGLAPVIALTGFGISRMGAMGISYVVLLVGIVLPVWGFKSAKGYKKAVVAAIDFDEKFFDGQIFYSRRNGIAL